MPGQENTTPIACQLTAMTPAERQRYETLKERLRGTLQETRELPEGYALRFEASKTLVLAVAEFITLESRCCPFYTFTLEVEANSGPLWLRITGPQEAKPFIKEALELPL